VTLELRKYRIIKLITDSSNEKLVNQIEQIIDCNSNSEQTLYKLTSPVKDELDLDKIMDAQKYKHPTKEELEQIIEDAAIEESVEALIKMI